MTGMTCVRLPSIEPEAAGPRSKGLGIAGRLFRSQLTKNADGLRAMRSTSCCDFAWRRGLLTKGVT